MTIERNTGRNTSKFLFSFTISLISTVLAAYYVSSKDAVEQAPKQVVESITPKTSKVSNVEQVKQDTHKVYQFNSTPDHSKLPSSYQWINSLHLSDNPSYAEINLYLNSILTQIESRVRPNPREGELPLLAVLAELHFEEVFISLLTIKGGSPFALDLAYLYANEEHKELILDNLSTEPGLIDLVIYFEWEEEARPYLISLLDNHPEKIDWKLTKVLLAYNDPQLYPKFEKVIVKGRYIDDVFRLIKNLPDIDLDRITDIAWENTKHDDHSRSYLSSELLPIGYKPALEYIVNHLGDNNGVSNTNFSAATLYSRYVEGPVGINSAQAWYSKNKNKIMFNKEQQRFFVPEEQL